MRIQVILNEDENSGSKTVTYLALCGWNIVEFEQVANDIKNSFESGEITFDETDQFLYEINQRLRLVIAHPSVWSKVSCYTDWKDVYLRFSKLYHQNDEAMTTRRKK